MVTGPVLSEDEIARHHSNGLLAPRHRVSEADLARLRTFALKVVADKRMRTGFSACYMPPASFFDYEGARMPKKLEGFRPKMRPLFLVRGVNRRPRAFQRNHVAA